MFPTRARARRALVHRAPPSGDGTSRYGARLRDAPTGEGRHSRGRGRSSGAWAWALAALALATGLPVSASAQTPPDRRAPPEPGLVEGVVIDRETRLPVEGVAVLLEPTDDSTGTSVLPTPAPVLTDQSGRFRFRGLTDGRYRLEVERIGYRPASGSLDLRATVGARVDVEMVSEAVELEPLFVVAEAGSLYLDNAGFYDRARRGIGRFVTRNEILDRNALYLTDVFRTMPGVRVWRGAGVGSDSRVLLRSGCVADVYVDGVRLLPPVSIDALVQPTDVEAVEVYQESEVPAAFRTTTCGAVVIWTHVPNPGLPGNPLTWKRVLAVVGFAAFAIVITR